MVSHVRGAPSHPCQGTNACYLDRIWLLTAPGMYPSIKPAKIPGPLESCNLAESSRWWCGLPEPRRFQSLHRPAQGWWGHHLPYLGMGEVGLPVSMNVLCSPCDFSGGLD